MMQVRGGFGSTLPKQREDVTEARGGFGTEVPKQEGGCLP